MPKLRLVPGKITDAHSGSRRAYEDALRELLFVKRYHEKNANPVFKSAWMDRMNKIIDLVTEKGDL